MSVSREVTTRGIVIARSGAGEGSARVFLYTEILGLLAPLAKSAREERSQLRAHLQPGTYGVFRLVKGRDTWRIAGVHAAENIHFSLAECMPPRAAAARVFAAVRQFVHGEGSDPHLFDVLWNFAAALPACRSVSEARAAESLAVIRMLAALGYVSPGHEQFLSASYDAASIAQALKEQPQLIKAVNEAIAASGL